jgi:hypothetical protein
MNAEQINDYLKGNSSTKIDLATLKELAKSENPVVEAAVLLLVYHLSLQSTLHFPAFQRTLNEGLHGDVGEPQREAYYKALQHIHSMLLRKGTTQQNYTLLTEFLRKILSIPQKMGTEMYMSNSIYVRYPELVSLKDPLEDLRKGFKSTFHKGEIEKSTAGCVILEHVTPSVCEACEIIAGESVSYADAHKGRQPNGHLILQTFFGGSKRQMKEVLNHSAVIVEPINSFITKATQL